MCRNKLFPVFLKDQYCWSNTVGPILFNAFLNNFFYKTEKASAHNFADDNTLSVFAKPIHKIAHSLKLEPETAVKCFSENEMTVNRDKLILISKKNLTIYAFWVLNWK